MNLDSEARSAQARKAALREVENRRAKIKTRDIGIVLAYRRLTAASMSKEEDIRAIQFLQSFEASPNLPDNETVFAYLARIVGLTKRRLRDIVSKTQNQEPNSAHFP